MPEEELPQPKELWDFVQRVLRGRYRRSLSDEAVDELCAEQCLWWLKLPDDQLAEIINWQAFVRRCTINRALDHLEKERNRRRLLREQGLFDARTADGDEPDGEIRHLASDGMVDDTFDDPIEKKEFLNSHRTAFDLLTDREQIVLLVYGADKLGQLPEGSTPQEHASMLLGRDEPWTANGFNVQVSRAGERLEELLGKYDEDYDAMYEARLAGLQSKRAASAMRRKLTGEQQAVLSVYAEIELGRRDPAFALIEAGHRAGLKGPMAEADYDGRLAEALSVVTKNGKDPLLRPLATWERVVTEWQKLNPGAGRPKLSLIRGGADEEAS